MFKHVDSGGKERSKFIPHPVHLLYVVTFSVKVRQHLVGGGQVVLTFLRSKKKKRKQRNKERVSTQKLLKSCHVQSQNIIVLVILERLELKIFLVCQIQWSITRFNVTWPLHFEVHFFGPAQCSHGVGILWLKSDFCLNFYLTRNQYTFKFFLGFKMKCYNACICKPMLPASYNSLF